ncbi:hypothetical protein Mapa_001593 [Marchantia paleacea]|nr:hypothetical protein Mapa_001593 [Marchantia paleacea]
MGFLKLCVVILLSQALMVALGAVSPDGTCGSTTAGNYTCDTGSCCSQYGFCGTTTAYCNAGCQAAYGQCGNGTEVASPGTPARPGLEMKACVANGTYALTFDDGPSNMTAAVVKTLERLNLKGAFFVVGLNLENTAENRVKRAAFRAAYYSGHLVASHSYNHPHLPTLTIPEVKEQLNKTANLFKELIGVKPRYFRAPYGEVDSDVVNVIKDYGYNLINWNLDPRDWESENETLILQSITEQLAAGSPATDSWIDVKHDTIAATVYGLEKIVKLVQSKGYKIVPLPECVGDKKSPYTM